MFVGKADMQSKLDNAMQDVNDKYLLLEQQEKNALRTVMIEERSRYCLFVSCLKPFVVNGILDKSGLRGKDVDGWSPKLPYLQLKTFDLINRT